MFRDTVASIYRYFNTSLLYVRLQPLEKVLKIALVLSSRSYRKWMSRPRKPELRQITVDRDLTMQVDLSKSIGAAFYWMGFHELNEWRFLHRHLRPDMVFMDIGANQGEFTLFAAKRLTRGTVLSFEPVNTYFNQLQDNVRINGFDNVKAFPLGLADKAGRVPVYMGEEGAGENEGLASIFSSGDRKRFVQEIDIRVLDELSADLRLTRLDFIKIDVEGAELLVLKGARKTIEKFRPWVMLEISDVTAAAAGYSVDDIKSFFSSLGYSLNLIAKGGTLKKQTATPPFCNVIFSPEK